MEGRKKDPATQRVTSPELVEFFIGVGVSPNCPTCNAGQTAIQVDQKREFVNVLANPHLEMEDDGISSRESHVLYPTLLTTCNNCGYVRAFSVHRINTWLNAKHIGRDSA